MRNRFFFIILSVLIISAIGINLIHTHLFKTQRLKLIDAQIFESSSTLLTESKFIESIKKSKDTEEVISSILGAGRIGKIFVIRNLKSEIQYQSVNVSLLNTELPIYPEWVTTESGGQYIRIRNISLLDSNLVVQVGLVLDWNFLNWEIIDQRVIYYVTTIVIALFLLSVILTMVLMEPLRILIGHLQTSTSNLHQTQRVDPLPAHLESYRKGLWAKSDEFASLLNTIQVLIDKINFNYKLTRQWTLQLAHELKTPLAVLRLQTEGGLKEKKVSAEFGDLTFQEIDHMSNVINQFLDWAEIENSKIQNNLYSIRAQSVIKTLKNRLDKLFPNRIVLEVKSDFSIITNPIHFEQLASNLIVNGLKYSSDESKVNVYIIDHEIIVSDVGSGIPDEVKSRLGEPFNVGSYSNENTGNGLGLAWVIAAARLYHWHFEIKSSSPLGTEVSIQFPKTDYTNNKLTS